MSDTEDALKGEAMFDASTFLSTCHKRSARFGALAMALAKAQGEFTKIAKGHVATVTSDKGNYKYGYAELSDYVEVARGPLARNGLAVLQPPIFDSNGFVVVETILVHGESEQWMSTELYMRPANDRPQTLASTITYARRYAYTAILGLVAEREDDDGQAGNGNGEERERASARQDRRREQAPSSKSDTKPPQGQPGAAPPPQRDPPAAAAAAAAQNPEKKPADPCEVVGRMMSAIQVLDGQAGAGGEGIAKAMELLGGKAPRDLDRAVAIALLGGTEAPGALRKLRDDLKARAAAKTTD